MPQHVSGLADVVRNPIYATGVGLLLFGQRQVQNGVSSMHVDGGMKGIWERMTDRSINSLSRELRDVTYIAGYDKKTCEPIIKTLEINPNALLKNLESDYLKESDPIKDYLLQLDVSSAGEMRKFTDCFKVASWYGPKELEYIHTYWKKWLVGSVANALNDDNCYNHLCIVLVGEQGLKKGFLI